MNTRSLGQEAETRAEAFLTKQGLTTVERNYQAKTGEIDLIMEQAGLLVFVEVRLRRNATHGTGAESVTYSKQRKIIRTAELFLQVRGNHWQDYRFDVISIGTQVDWIRSAFTLD